MLSFSLKRCLQLHSLRSTLFISLYFLPQQKLSSLTISFTQVSTMFLSFYFPPRQKCSALRNSLLNFLTSFIISLLLTDALITFYKAIFDLFPSFVKVFVSLFFPYFISVFLPVIGFLFPHFLDFNIYSLHIFSNNKKYPDLNIFLLPRISLFFPPF